MKKLTKLDISHIKSSSGVYYPYDDNLHEALRGINSLRELVISGYMRYIHHTHRYLLELKNVHVVIDDSEG